MQLIPLHQGERERWYKCIHFQYFAVFDRSLAKMMDWWKNAAGALSVCFLVQFIVYGVQLLSALDTSRCSILFLDPFNSLSYDGAIVE